MIVPIIISVLLVVIGQILVKLGINSIQTTPQDISLINFYLRLLLNPMVLSGIFIYAAAIFFWIYVLSKVELSFAYPFMALTYVLVIIASGVILKENIPALRWIGVIVICFGVLLVSKS